MTETELIALLESEERDAALLTTIEAERATAQDYYHSRPYGNEQDGRSQVVSSEVRDTVEWALPALLKIFTSGKRVVEFEPQTPEDVEGAEQATEACNYVFFRQNNGFLTLYTMFKDALLEKTGAVKWSWDAKVTTELERYRGLTDDQLSMLAMQEGLQVVAHSANPTPLGTLHDVDVRVPKDAGRISFMAIPPEELRVARRHNSPSLADCPYVAHVSKKTLSELRAMGFDVSESDLDADAGMEMSPGRLARMEDNFPGTDPGRQDEASREGWVLEEYVLVDYDGDGQAERRKIIRTATKILYNEECEQVQIAAITPMILTHRFYGLSLADVVCDLQLLSSTIWRQMLDNLYHANNQRTKVLASPDGRVQANIDDLLNTRPGGIIREYTPNAVTPMAPPWVGGQAFPMLEYIDQKRTNTSGVNYLTSGLDADSINKTARGATIAQNMMQERIELIARVFAEIGVKEIFRGILYLMTRHATGPMVFRLRNKFIAYDPRTWKTSYDMTCNVGLGTGNKDQQLMHLSTIAQAQLGMLSTPMSGIVTAKNIYNVQAKIAENAGFIAVDDFWTDPEQAGQGQPGLDPQAMQAIQMLQGQIADLQSQLQDKQAELAIKGRELDIKGREVEIKAFEADTDRMETQAKVGAEMSNAKANSDMAAAQMLAVSPPSIDLTPVMQLIEGMAMRPPAVVERSAVVKRGRAVKQKDGSWSMHVIEEPIKEQP